jgi:hypothetical protein
MAGYLACAAEEGKVANIHRLSEGTLRTKGGLSLYWVIYQTSPHHGKMAVKNKVFMVSNGTMVSYMTFLTSPEYFANYEHDFDAMAKSLRYK